MEAQKQLITIDVGRVLASRLGAERYRRIPACVVRWLERFIRQDRLNELLRNNYPLTGADFCAGVLRDMRVDYRVIHPERLPSAADGPDAQRVLFVSNHPLGGLDGICLIDLLARRVCPEGVQPAFIVNDLLMAVEPLADVFVPVNKHGRQSRSSAAMVDEVFDGPRPVMMFPAGLVSRRRHGQPVRDLAWNPMFVRRAAKSGRDIIPLHFGGENSNFFYKFANLRERLGMKFNIEMLRLPAELVGAEGRTFDVTVGKRIPAATLCQELTPLEEAARIRGLIYEPDM